MTIATKLKNTTKWFKNKIAPSPVHGMASDDKIEIKTLEDLENLGKGISEKSIVIASDAFTDNEWFMQLDIKTNKSIIVEDGAFINLQWLENIDMTAADTISITNAFNDNDDTVSIYLKAKNVVINSSFHDLGNLEVLKIDAKNVEINDSFRPTGKLQVHINGKKLESFDGSYNLQTPDDTDKDLNAAVKNKIILDAAQYTTK